MFGYVSHTPLLYGLIDAEFRTWILNISHVSMKISPMNSPPLSLKIFFGAPNIEIQYFVNAF